MVSYIIERCVPFVYSGCVYVPVEPVGTQSLNGSCSLVAVVEHALPLALLGDIEQENSIRAHIR